MVVTGAPVENMEFEQVDYWDELCRIFEWSKTNVYSSFFICWGAQAALYYKYGLRKYRLDRKMFGVFEHVSLDTFHPLMRGLVGLLGEEVLSVKTYNDVLDAGCREIRVGVIPAALDRVLGEKQRNAPQLWSCPRRKKFRGDL